MRVSLVVERVRGRRSWMSKIQLGRTRERVHFITAMLAQGGKIGQLPSVFGIARSTAYLWRARFHEGGEAALTAQPRGPLRRSGRSQPWREIVLALRARHPTWGPRKLWHQLQRDYPRQLRPSERTLARMLRAAGCVGPRRRRRPAGPPLPKPELTRARRSNAVWTIDFKGYFRTGDGARCLPLTLRDLFSRYVHLIEHIPVPSEAALRVVLSRCFRRYGVPRVLRVDNGKPFAGEGARGLSGLSVWWTRLGIRVEFIRPGKPQDNGAHEQFHRVLKCETAQPPAADLAAQARRFRRFRQHYNEVRPHAHLQMRTPGELYRPAPAPLPKIHALPYPEGWLRKRVSKGGLIRWAGRPRMIGRAFKYEHIGLKPLTLHTAPRGAAVQVWLGKLLLGELHASDPPTMRPIRYRPAKRQQK